MATPHPTPHKLLELTKGKLYDEQRDRAVYEPQPKKELVPRCPARFNKAEKREWRFYKAILENYSLFNVACAPVLEKLCTAEAHYKDCATKVGETGIIIKGKDGFPVRNPYFAEMRGLEVIILKYHQELALSNTGLAKIGSLSLKAKKQKDGLESLLD